PGPGPGRSHPGRATGHEGVRAEGTEDGFGTGSRQGSAGSLPHRPGERACERTQPPGSRGHGRRGSRRRSGPGVPPYVRFGRRCRHRPVDTLRCGSGRTSRGDRHRRRGLREHGMSDLSMDILTEWSRIESAGPVGKGSWRSKRLPVLADARHLVLAVDELGQRHLLVPQGGVELPSNTRSPLAVATREFAFDGDGDSGPVQGRYLDIHCQVKTLNGQFDKVIADVIEAVQESRDAAAGAAATVASWRRLFTTLVDSPGLTYQQRL